VRRQLERAVAKARGFAVPREVFEAWLRERAKSDDELAKLDVDGLYLACACAHGDANAARVLDEQYVSKIGPALTHLRRDDAFTQAVRSVVLESLLVQGRIAGYAGRGDLLRWVRAVAIRAALDALGGARREEPVELERLLDVAVPPSEPDDAERLRGVIASALGALPDELRGYLRRYYLEHFTLEELAALYRVSIATASRRLAAAREQVAKETRARLARELKLTGAEVESMLQLVQSRFELSRSALKTKP